MAQVDADLYTEQNEKFKRAGGNTAHLRRVSYKIPITAPAGTAVAAADTLAVFQLPVGSIVRPDLSSAVWSAGTSAATAFTISLGDVTDPDRYMLTESVLAVQQIPSLIHSAGLPAGQSTPYTVPAITAAGVDDGVLLVTAVAISAGTWSAGESAGHIELVVELP